MQKVVLLTGAAGGIGTGLVKVLSDAGWVVLGSDHPEATPHQSTLEQCHAWIPADLVALSQILSAWMLLSHKFTQRPVVGTLTRLFITPRCNGLEVFINYLQATGIRQLPSI